MAKINSRNKGATFERQIANTFKEQGYPDAYRTEQHNGQSQFSQPDVSGVPYLNIECKAVEKLNIHDAMEQSKRDSEIQENGGIPIVIHKKNYKPILVTMFMDDWFDFFNTWAKVQDDRQD